MLEESLLSLLSSNISALRTARGLSQAELAEKADISIGYLNDLERGRKWIGAGSFEKLAFALGVDPFRLLMPSDKTKLAENLKTIEAIEREIRDRVQETVSDVLIRHYSAEKGSGPTGKPEE